MEITSGRFNDKQYSYIVDLGILNDKYIHLDNECLRLSGNPGDANTVTFNIGFGIKLSSDHKGETQHLISGI